MAKKIPKKNVKKAVKKEVHSALVQAKGKPSANPPLLSPKETIKSTLSTLPKLRAQKEKKALSSLKKDLLSKKHKLQKKHSHAISLGNDAPQHAHPEGVRWLKTMRKQERTKAKAFSKKMVKKGK